MADRFYRTKENDMAEPTSERTELATRAPTDLVQHAIEHHADAEAIEKILLSVERRERFEAERAFSEAMCACQAELPAVVKDATNPQTQSLYARLETIGRSIDPIIHKHGFSLLFDSEDTQDPEMIRVACDVCHSGGHCKRYRLPAMPPDDKGIAGKPNKTRVHGIASTLTYGERYLTCRIFKVRVAGLDDDGNAPVATISDEDAVALHEWIEKLADARGEQYKKQLDRFLGAFGVKDLAHMPESRFAEALASLKRKVNEASGGANR